MAQLMGQGKTLTVTWPILPDNDNRRTCSTGQQTIKLGVPPSINTKDSNPLHFKQINQDRNGVHPQLPLMPYEVCNIFYLAVALNLERQTFRKSKCFDRRLRKQIFEFHTTFNFIQNLMFNGHQPFFGKRALLSIFNIGEYDFFRPKKILGSNAKSLT